MNILRYVGSFFYSGSKTPEKPKANPNHITRYPGAHAHSYPGAHAHSYPGAHAHSYPDESVKQNEINIELKNYSPIDYILVCPDDDCVKCADYRSGLTDPVKNEFVLCAGAKCKNKVKIIVPGPKVPLCPVCIEKISW